MMGVVPEHSEEGALDRVLEQTTRRQGGVYLGYFVPWFENHSGKKQKKHVRDYLQTVT